jgi:hypothetical protein
MISSKSMWEATEAIRQLRQLSKLVDPASGMSVYVKHGPISRDDEPDADAKFVRLEVSENCDSLIGLLLDEAYKSLHLRVSLAKSQVTEVSAAVNAAEAFLVKDGYRAK